MRSRSRVVTPGTTASTTARSARTATPHARRIAASSAGDLSAITTAILSSVGRLPDPARPGLHELANLIVNVHDRPLRVDGEEDPPAPVVIHQRRGPPAKHLQPVEDRALRVVAALDQLGAVQIAPAGHPRRFDVQVVDRAADGAHPAAREAPEQRLLTNLEGHDRVE